MLTILRQLLLATIMRIRLRNKDRTGVMWMCLFLLAVAPGARSDTVTATFENVKRFFDQHRAVLEEIVRDAQACPDLKMVKPVSPPNVSSATCGNSDAIPTRIARNLLATHILWAQIDRGTYGQPKWDATAFYSITFVLESYGTVTRGAGASITFFKDEITPLAFNNGWVLLTELPSHWAFRSSPH
jgi:hypothetical protein